MRVHDLDCFSELTHSTDIRGGSIADTMLSLKIIDRQLSIAMGGNLLFETKLPETPSGIQISIEDKSGMQTYASSFGIGSGIKNLSVFTRNFGNEYRAHSFSSSSSGYLMF
jgi:hypothetical protein